MNPNPDDPSKLTDNVIRALRGQQRTGRLLIGLALALGVVAIVASIAIVWANLVLITPMQRLLLQDYPAAQQQLHQKIGATSQPPNDRQPSQLAEPGPKNREGKPLLSIAELNWRHVQVTAACGKVLVLTDASIALLAGGTLVILLLVIFNRRATLRQINTSLSQISDQINELQRRQGPNQ